MIERDPARLYKDVVGELTAAADALRERDRERATALSKDLVGLDDAMVRAELRAAMSRLAVEIRWELVLDALWEEQWMTLKPASAAGSRRGPRAARRAGPGGRPRREPAARVARHRFPFLR